MGPFDIAAIKLKTPLVFDDYVKAIGLPAPNQIPSGTGTLTGWGSVSKTIFPKLPSILQKVSLPLIDIKSCRNALSHMGTPGEVHDTNICTGPLTGGYSSCNAS